METACGYVDDKILWFSSDEKKWITHWLKCAALYPNDVQIIKRPEENDGCIYVKAPAHWLKVKPPKKMNLSEEERAMRRKLAYRTFGKQPKT